MIRAEEFLRDEKVACSESFIQNPEISVIMPTYCRGDNGLLKRAIQSVLSQTYPSLELIIVDDGSVDGTRSLVESFLAQDKRILYIRNDRNSGLPALRVDQGLLHARGKYIAYQFDDDYWEPDALEILRNILSRQQAPALVYGDWNSYNAENGKNDVHDCDFKYYEMTAGNFIANNSVLHHRELFERYGMYDCHTAMRRLCDWDLWLRWGKEASFFTAHRLVSHVNVMTQNSLGQTAAYDLPAFRIFSALPRNEKLLPGTIRDYAVDDTSFCVSPLERKQLETKHIEPWRLQHYLLSPQAASDQTSFGQPQRLVVTKCDYDSTVNIMVENFVAAQPERYRMVYIPENQLDEFSLQDGDCLLLCRATTQSTLELVRKIRAESRRIPVLYFLDDNLLNIYKLGEDFNYIAPGSAMYGIVEELLTLADRVVTFSPYITQAVKKYNGRVSTLTTNIPFRYLKAENDYSEEGAFRIIFMGGSARRDEFSRIEDDLVRISQKYGNRVEFHFLGYIPEKMKSVKTSTVVFAEYTSSYYEYLNRLQSMDCNLLLCPLEDSEFKRCKSPVKLLEACCCGAIGIYSDVPVYDCIQDGVQGYKITNGSSWFDKIDRIIRQPESAKKEIFSHALALVREQYCTENHTAEFNLAVDLARVASAIERKTILYVSHSAYLAGAENHLFRHCVLMQQAGFTVKFALPASSQSSGMELIGKLKSYNISILYWNYTNSCEVENMDVSAAASQGEQLCALLEAEQVALVHSCTLIPEIGYAAHQLGIPYAASLYATESNRVVPTGQDLFIPDAVHSDSYRYAVAWQDKLHRPSTCIRSYVPNDFYREREIASKPKYRVAICGTLQERKGQAELIKAIGLLKGKYDLELYLFGYNHFFPQYKESCEDVAREFGITERIHWEGMTADLAGRLKKYEIDFLVCASTFESFPQVILEAMALEIPVVSTPAGGISELIQNGVTGFLSDDFSSSALAKALEHAVTSVENGRITAITNNAKHVVKRECSKKYVTSRLVDCYLSAIQFCRKNRAGKVRQSFKLSDTAVLQSRQIESEILVFSKNIEKARKYDILCEQNEVSGIGVIFASEGTRFSGEVTLSVQYRGRLLRQSVLNLKHIQMQTWTYFPINVLYGCGGKTLRVKISVKYDHSSERIGLYEDGRNRTPLYRLMKKVGFPNTPINVLYCDFECERRMQYEN